MNVVEKNRKTPVVTKNVLLVGMCSCLLVAIGSYFFYKHSRVAVPTVVVKQKFMSKIDAFKASVHLLRQTIHQDKSSVEIQNAFKRTKEVYKQIEFIVEFYFPYTAKHLNGPAIDEVEFDDPLQNTIPAEGLQVIEELIFPSYDSKNKEQAIEQIEVLAASINRLYYVFPETAFTDQQMFLAFRQEIHRIITLGIVGFDSPIALNSMSEAAFALESMADMLVAYREPLEQKKPGQYKALQTSFATAIQYLRKHPDFNQFDRAFFITAHANILSAKLVEAQKELSIAFPDELYALSPSARTVFEEGVFNANYFAPDFASHFTAERAQLGKMLFFDPLLSGNNSRSCASCHVPEKAFTDGNKKSVAFNFKGEVTRNAPTIINAGLQRALFHDLRASFLEDQATDVVINANEMHGSLAVAANEIRKSPEYIRMFQAAFTGIDSTAVNERNIKVALASYTRSLSTMNARFDQYMRGDKTKLNKSEIRGFSIFAGKAKCATCHFIPLFNGTVPPTFEVTEAEIIGVPATTDTINPVLDPDMGKFALYKKDLHKHAFKTPTLRNIVLTAPYMHNGVYKTLEEVVEFYNKGGGVGLGLDVPNQTLPPDPLNLTQQEKQDLIAFLHTLTDTTGTTARPVRLPGFPGNSTLSSRTIGGSY